VRPCQAVGLQGWKRQIQHFYHTRGVAYMSAMKEFVAGYKEGIREAAAPVSRDSTDDMQLDLDPAEFDPQPPGGSDWYRPPPTPEDRKPKDEGGAGKSI